MKALSRYHSMVTIIHVLKKLLSVILCDTEARSVTLARTAVFYRVARPHRSPTQSLCHREKEKQEALKGRTFVTASEQNPKLRSLSVSLKAS